MKNYSWIVCAVSSLQAVSLGKSGSGLRGWLHSLSGLVILVAGMSAMGAEPAVAPPEDAVAKPSRNPDVVYVPTPQTVVDEMLKLAELKRNDVVYDLGCGDGRIVVTAAKKFGVKAFGFDIDPQRVKEARENVRTNGVQHLVTIKQADIFTLDLREASVVTLYLLPDLNVKLMPQLAKLKAGSRILSHEFDMRGAKPASTHRIEGEHDFPGEELDEEPHTIYKWIVPWEKDGIVDP